MGIPPSLGHGNKVPEYEVAERSYRPKDEGNLNLWRKAGEIQAKIQGCEEPAERRERNYFP